MLQTTTAYAAAGTTSHFASGEHPDERGFALLLVTHDKALSAKIADNTIALAELQR
jgi:hypothetical protein